MSGHSRWSTIKRKKGAADAVRGKIFTKLSKEITVSARIGGGDPAGNPRLRLAIQAARAAAMPMDNVSRAIKKGTGELEGGQIEELVYEGYGPGGVAFIIEVTTDNQNRTIAEVRSIFDKAGGNLGKTGSVSFIFSKLGCVRFDGAKFSEDRVMEAALDAGAQDVKTEGGQVVVYTAPSDFHAVKEALDKAGLEALEAELTMVPSNTVKLDEDMAKRTLALVDRLEDNDDVQKVFGNFDISDEIMARLSES